MGEVRASRGLVKVLVLACLVAAGGSVALRAPQARDWRWLRGLALVTAAPSGCRYVRWWSRCASQGDPIACARRVWRACGSSRRRQQGPDFVSRMDSMGQATEWWLSQYLVGLDVPLPAGCGRLVAGELPGWADLVLPSAGGGVILALLVLFRRFYRARVRTRARPVAGGRGVVLAPEAKSHHLATAAWAVAKDLDRYGLVRLAGKSCDDSGLIRWRRPKHAMYIGHFGRRPWGLPAEDRLLLLGRPGAGKTVHLVQLLSRWAATGGHLMLTDVKPELYGLLSGLLRARGYRVLSLSPFSPHGGRYGFLRDAVAGGGGGDDLELLAACLLPPGGKDDSQWMGWARSWVHGLLSYAVRQGVPFAELGRLNGTLQSADPAEAIKALASGADRTAAEILSNLAGMVSSPRTWGSMMSYVSRALEPLALPTVQDFLKDESFSLFGFIQDESRPWAVVVLHPDWAWDSGASDGVRPRDQFFVMLTSWILRLLLRRGHGWERPVLCCLDEIGQFPKIETLSNSMNLGRDRGLAIAAAAQSIMQLRERYGRGFESAFSSVLSFSVNDVESAEFVSSKLGETSLEVAEQSEQGLFSRGRSARKHLQRRKLLESYEIMDLRQGEYVLWRSGGLRIRGEVYPYWRDRFLKRIIVRPDD